MNATTPTEQDFQDRVDQTVTEVLAVAKTPQQMLDMADTFRAGAGKPDMRGYLITRVWRAAADRLEAEALREDAAPRVLYTTKGHRVETTRTDEEAVAVLEADPRASSFARDLCRQYHQRGLTHNQLPWLHKLANEAGAEEPQAPDLPNLGALVQLLQKAGEHLRYPKVTLDLDGRTVRLSLAGPNARQPGSVNVTDGLPYGQNQWFGRIATDGSYQEPRGGAPAFVVEALTEMAEDVEGFVARYGQRSGNCCFCNRELTTDESTAVGYGPVCAGHYGLPWGKEVAA